MASYVTRGGEQVFAPPFLQQDTRLQAFVLEGERGALQRTVDRCLNAPAGGATSYRVLSEHLLLVYAPIGATRATTPPDSQKGYTPETDVAFWVLVGAGHERGGAWILDRLAWFLPYVWVDVPTTMATGREVYGYPKELCWLSAGPPAVFAAETLVLPVYTPQTPLQRQPILRVDRSGPGGLASEWTSARHAVADIARALELEARDPIIPGLSFWVHLLEYLLRREVPMVFLKQFRDAVHPERACYQAILESPARVVSVAGAGLLAGEHTATIWSYASHPIAEDLGLGDASGGPLALRVPLAFEVRFDFSVELAKTIWQG